MAKPIRIPIISDVKDFLRGTSDVEDALDDVVDSLDELNDEAKKDDATEALRDIEDGAKDAESAVDGLERKFRDAMDDVKKDADDAGRKIGKDLDDGFDKAKQGADDFKNEAGQSGREAAASFGGGFDDVGDFVQETAANAFGGFGPIGAIAGGAAAIGVGLVVAELEKAKQRAEELKALARDLADQLRETGQVDLADNLTDYLFEHADALDKIKQGAEDIGVSFEDLKSAYLGDEEALARVNAATEEYGSGIQNLGEYLSGNAAAAYDMAQAANDNAQAQELAEEVIGEVADTTAGAAEAALAQAEALDASREAAERARDTLSGLIGAENGYYESLQTANATIEENGSTWDAATEAGRENRDAVLETAQAMHDLTQAQIDAGTPMSEVTSSLEGQRSALYDLAIEAGATEEEAQALIDTMLGTPGTIKTHYEADNSDALAAQAQVDSWHPENRTVWINGVAHTYQFQSAVDNAAARIRPPVITMRGRIGYEAV